ncbi:GNAT family protein [Labrys neptuniae]|uniref:GNAT family protein n=1 Tax=Labrys neptuniae TaxID=376174 RepID=A0ABV3PHM6_9HYPH|nr:GNAT family protein [Labrys neptuniae]MDT3380763.1 GNAT family protein [Labrys neptuniae]
MLKRVSLRSPENSDFDFLASLRRDSALQALLLNVVTSTDDDAVAGWLERRKTDPNGSFMVIADSTTDEPIGFAQITNIHHRNRHGFIGIVIAPSAQGKGLGRVAMENLVATAKEKHRLEKILLEVRADNFAALSLYKSMNFRIVGTMLNHFRTNDDIYDVVLMEKRI